MNQVLKVLRYRKRPAAGLNCESGFGKSSQSYGEVVFCFELLGTENVLQQYFTQRSLKSF